MTINALPDEILLNVVSYLTPQEQATTSSVSKLFMAICNDEALWRFHTKHDYTTFYEPQSDEKWKEIYKYLYLNYRV